jgi:uncharacterized protein (DUF1778 family)
MLNERKSKYMNIRISETEYDLLKDAAQFYNKTLSGFVLDTALNRIEDMEDLAAANEYLRHKMCGEIETLSHDEVVRKYEA